MYMIRRAFLVVLVSSAALPWPGSSLRAAAAQARPSTSPPGRDVALGPGRHRIVLDIGAAGALYLPKGYTTGGSWPFLVVLHGAAGSAESVARVFPLADEFGVIILAPESREWTWDGLLGHWGPDLQMIHAAIEYAIAHSSIDPQRVGMAGFSDGASYALSLGIANGDVFTRLMAFSAGVLAPPEVRGRPRIFISHGTRDRVMPIDDTGRKIVARLRESAYDVTYHEFAGGHGTPLEIVREAFQWFASTRGR